MGIRRYECHDCEKEKQCGGCSLVVKQRTGKPIMCAMSFFGMKCEWVEVEK